MPDFIDVQCRVGNGPVLREGALKNTSELLSLMDDFHVKKAIAYHSIAQYSDALLGNSMISELNKTEERFMPQWVVTPQLWDIFPSPKKLTEEMKKNRVLSVRLFPAHHGFSLRRYAAGELLNAMAEYNIPVFINFDQLSSWDALYDICRDYPENRFVICGTGYRCLRYIVPIMDSCYNLYAETSNFIMHNGLRKFCDNMGAERLLFGSGVPDASLAAAVSQICLSDLTDEEKQMIASGNIKWLLGEVKL